MRRFLHGLLGVLMLAPIPFAEAVTPRKDLVFADLGQPQTNPWVLIATVFKNVSQEH